MENMGYNINSKDLVNKKIVSLERITAEFGRTYRVYTGVICEDGTRVLLSIEEPYLPDPDLKDMVKSTFFTPDEVANKAKHDAIKERRRKEECRDTKRRELERLKRELNEE